MTAQYILGNEVSTSSYSLEMNEVSNVLLLVSTEK